MEYNLDSLRTHLRDIASAETALVSEQFFKTGVGHYAEGDKFYGIKVPVLRKISMSCRCFDFATLKSLIYSEYHEERMLALLILIEQFKNQSLQDGIYAFYVDNMVAVNNWDLVDTSAPKIVGPFLADKSRAPLYQWAEHSNMWFRRIAVVSTQYFIKRGEFSEILKLSEMLLYDKEDLMHKAVGWMLRELGKRDKDKLDSFLKEHYNKMPRTMLRYAIEKHPESERQNYLKGNM